MFGNVTVFSPHRVLEAHVSLRPEIDTPRIVDLQDGKTQFVDARASHEMWTLLAPPFVDTVGP